MFKKKSSSVISVLTITIVITFDIIEILINVTNIVKFKKLLSDSFLNKINKIAPKYLLNCTLRSGLQKVN